MNIEHQAHHSARRPFLPALLCILSLLVVASGQAQETNGTSKNDATPTTDVPSVAKPDMGGIILVVGAEGDPKYGLVFQHWANTWKRVAERSGAPIRVIGLDDDAGESQATDRDQLANLIGSVKPDGKAPLWIVFIGHGTFTRGVAKFNLQGPDVSAQEIAQWIEPIKRPLVIVNCASASAPFINRLSGPNRIIVTATKSGIEQNFAHFGKYFSEAIASVDTDLDHDDEVSVQEAFLRAAAEVRQFYEAEDRIPTEHALIDDNGDGKGTPATMFRGTRPIAQAADGSALDGKVAKRITLVPGGSPLPLTDAERELRATIESQLDELRTRKPEMNEAEYDAALEPLMVQLAKLYQAAETRRDAKGETDPEAAEP